MVVWTTKAPSYPHLRRRASRDDVMCFPLLLRQEGKVVVQPVPVVVVVAVAEGRGGAASRSHCGDLINEKNFVNINRYYITST